MKAIKQVWELALSVLAGFFGVQSAKNYKKDFSEYDSIFPFIVMGLLMLVGFIFFVIALVQLAS
ncbi:DUF2970 domain-containing protein [Agaribacter marinus]|uniref:DUF2970 domain-containing protein n=1 Tax=Agaribacter marinus TaxID=1431249 RepID=A0AA37T5A6_9ALTE|nr:DUF2970 domain-containing protein [Agaribacter marinus]GLR72308.1 hypothetical protein GCM10007852_32160 [Agaribacter marinus]